MQTNVLFLITSLNVGGAEMMLYKTVKYLDKMKFKPVVVSMVHPGHAGEMIRNLGITVYSLGMKEGFPDPRAFYNLIKIIHQEKPLIIYSWMFHADLLGRIAGKLARIPVVISSVRNENIGGRRRERILSITDFMVDKVVAVSKAAGEQQVTRGVTKRVKLEIIYNGIEMSSFNLLPCFQKEGFKKKLAVPHDHQVLISIGRLVAQKNHELLLRAFAGILSAMNNCTLIVVGDGSLREQLKKLAIELGISDNIEFLGTRTDVTELLAVADIFVLTSLWEGLPNVVLEAMAAGKPVLATAVGGTPEIIVEGETGFLVEPDIDLVTKKLKEAISLSPEEKHAMGNAARKRIEANFTMEKCVEKTQTLFNILLTAKVN